MIQSRLRIPPYGLALTLVLGIAGASAQPAASTGTGGGPASTSTAPNTSTVGRTMPPAGAGGTERGTPERTEMQKKDDGIQKGICIGCGPK
ncbi:MULTISPECIES: hypothetical protein [Methylobacterium]|uniref:Uncharacterized protein n=1 Tax=Methylobacterium jeotgali TaxID=381630 RepID=A0ABQ4SW60_9HYPH|nr:MULTISPECIES: hypothetical protein [Methylobacterium]GBU18874.1 hypothetical protein AwMethylo_30890 [Methylobacterium sp.]GJE06481.1 hypothetical protein AOPFMNJM_1801 [Methylobacterium jeotgali]